MGGRDANKKTAVAFPATTHDLSSREFRGQGPVLATRAGLLHGGCSLPGSCADRALCLRRMMACCMLAAAFKKVARTGSRACDRLWISACRLQSSRKLRGQGPVLATDAGLLHASCKSSRKLRGQGPVLATDDGSPHAGCSLQESCTDRVLCLQRTIDHCMLVAMFKRVARTGPSREVNKKYKIAVVSP